MSSLPLNSAPSSEAVIKNRFLGFIIWQSISSSFIFIFFKILTYNNSSSFLYTILTFLIFQISQFLFSLSLSIFSSPKYFSPLSPLQLSCSAIRCLFASGDSFSSVDFKRRFRLSANLVFFVFAASVSGFLSIVSTCGFNEFRGFVFGFLYAVFYVYKQLWVLEFPIIQRPLFYSFKMRLPWAAKRALRLSCAAYLVSVVLLVFLPDQFGDYVTMGKFIVEQLVLFAGIFSVFLSWELSHHLHRVLHTKRFVFAPPKGSAAAETNPSEPLLAALEESVPGSLGQCLAYLDLSMVCENNVDVWRRAAVFEETGETYKRVIAVCLRPLEHLASTLAEGFESQSSDKALRLSNQLQLQTDLQLDPKYYEPLNNFQQCAWCARAVAFLTARSHTEDKFGVAQLSGSNAAVVSTILSCLLAVELFMGKKTNYQSSHLSMGPAGIKWATLNTGRRDIVVPKKRSGRIYSKAYAISDVLKTSIYLIVSSFQDEMLASDKAGLLEKDWLISTKPLFGSRDLLLHKLCLFLDFRAT